MEANTNTQVLTGWDAVLAGRKTGIFYVHNEEPIALKLTRSIFAVAEEEGGKLAEVKEDPELQGFVRLTDPLVIGKIIAKLTADHEMTRGPGITVRRLTKSETDQIKALSKQERLMRGGDWVTELDEDDFLIKCAAQAVVEPTIPVNLTGDFKTDLEAKAAWLRDTLSPIQLQELNVARRDLDGFNLQRIEEKVKN